MDKTRAALSVYRLKTARQCLTSAKALVDISDYKGAANRSYYAIFHSMRSVLVLEAKDFSKHAAVGAFFRKDYIKTGVFDVRMSDIIVVTSGYCNCSLCCGPWAGGATASGVMPTANHTIAVSIHLDPPQNPARRRAAAERIRSRKNSKIRKKKT